MELDTFDKILSAPEQDRTALIYEQGGVKVTLSYAALRSRVGDRAAELDELDSACRGIVCDGSIDCVIEILACARAGLRFALLPINAEQRHVELAGCDTLWCDDETFDELSGSLCKNASASDGGILFFTSGTVSGGRAVELTQQSLCASAYNGWSLLPLGADDVLMCMLPLDHVFGFVCGLLWGLRSGAAVALGRGAAHYSDDLAFFDPTSLSAVPMLLGFFLKNRLLNPELSLVLIGAGDCPAEMIAAVKAMGIRVSFGYGMTETSSGVALSLGDDPYAMTICPDDKIEIAPDGEILITAPTCVMRGYAGDRDATDEVLKDGVLYSGDIGHIDSDGCLHVTGRKKEIIVLSDGTKIFLPEYERELQSCLPGRDIAVTVRNGAPALIITGEESERGTVISNIEGFMRSLPTGKRLKDIIFISAPIPRTGTGKVARGRIQSVRGNKELFKTIV